MSTAAEVQAGFRSNKMEVFNPSQVDRIRDATAEDTARAIALLRREAPDLIRYIIGGSP